MGCSLPHKEVSLLWMRQVAKMPPNSALLTKKDNPLGWIDPMFKLTFSKKLSQIKLAAFKQSSLYSLLIQHLSIPFIIDIMF